MNTTKITNDRYLEYNQRQAKESLKLTKILIFFLLILETFLGVLYLDSKNGSELSAIGGFLLLNFFWLLVSWKLLSGKIVSSFFFIIVFLYILHFGQVIIDGVFPYYTYDYLDYVQVYMRDYALRQKTIMVCFLCINLLFLGGAIEQTFLNGKEKENVALNCSCLYRTSIKIIFIISFVFRFLLDCVQLYKAIYEGYSGAIGVSVSGVFSAIAGMWYAIVPLMYLCVSNSKKKKFVLMCVFYMAVTMLSGNRGHQFTSILMLVVVIITNSKKKIGFFQLLKYLFWGYVSMCFLDIVFAMRTFGINYFFDNFFECISGSLKANIILETLGTFGETIYTPYLTIAGYGTNFQPFFGECFFKSIVSIIPDVFGVFTDVNNAAIFTKNLGTQNAIGGSFVGELYYSFGELYLVFAVAFGMLFAKISRNIERKIKQRNIAGLWFDIPCMTYLFWLMRDCVGNFVRPIVWFVLLYYLTNLLLKNKNRNYRKI